MAIVSQYGALILVAAVIGGALLLARLLLRENQVRYERLASLLPADRASCFHALREATGGKLAIHWAVSVGQLLSPRAEGKRPAPPIGRLGSIGVDFVLCDSGSLEPRLAVLLHDGEPTTPEAVRRHQQLVEAFASAQLPLVLLPRADEYSADEVHHAIETASHAKAKAA
ncbi:MAG: DUF2726 domain-containing protein [Planctomycetales bacterium]|nr:DUF2726 domain-containing protein [Planctomycetales bacterium]